jgi:hypothetical protein
MKPSPALVAANEGLVEREMGARELRAHYEALTAAREKERRSEMQKAARERRHAARLLDRIKETTG